MRAKSADLAESADWGLLSIDGAYAAIKKEALFVAIRNGQDADELCHEALMYLCAEVNGKPAVWRESYRAGGMPYVRNAARRCMFHRAKTENIRADKSMSFNPFIDDEDEDD